MWTEGGQIAHLSFGGFRGGGGKGGGGGGGQYTPPAKTVLTDPVDGTTYVDDNFGPTSWFQIGGPREAPVASAADRLNQHIAERRAQEKQTSDANVAQTQQAGQQAQSQFVDKRQGAYDDALRSVMQAFTRQGADPSQYLASDIQPELQRQFNSIQDLDPNPSAAFPTSLGDTIAGNVLSGKRTAASTAYNNIFTPNFSANAFQDSAIDPFVNQIVGEQFDPLQAGLTNAQKRGTLKDSGYQAALDALGARRTAATSSVRSLGQGILGQDRSRLDELISGGRTDINNMTFGSNVDPNSYLTRAQGQISSDLSGLGGALRGAVGDTKYADLTDLLNAGGTVQGATNPNSTNLTPGLGGTPVDDELAKRQRGLGNAGAF